MFQQCPRRYKFHYIDDLARIYGKPRPYFTMGDHIHAALKDFLSIVPVEERTVARLEDLLREKWQRNRKGFKGLDDEKQWGERALSQVRWFAQSQDLSVTPLMLEDFHSVELSPKITLVGKIDRVDQEAEGGLHIIDYKTGRSTPSYKDNDLMQGTSLQLALYLRAAYEILNCIHEEVEVDYAEYYSIAQAGKKRHRPGDSKNNQKWESQNQHQGSEMTCDEKGQKNQDR